jgi:hypothetical protein
LGALFEAGAHAYAARNGRYSSLTDWHVDENGDLYGEITVPMAVGMVGGATKVHPTAQVAMKILDVKSAPELAQVIAAVGLAQNLAAINALATWAFKKDIWPCMHGKSQWRPERLKVLFNKSPTNLSPNDGYMWIEPKKYFLVKQSHSRIVD